MPTTVRTATLTQAFLAALLLCLILGGCGSNGFIFIAVNTGIVVGGDACNGEFNMRNDGGLVLVVVIGSGTAIFLPNGTAGTCGNIHSGSHATVSGPTQNGHVNANKIQLQ